MTYLLEVYGIIAVIGIMIAVLLTALVGLGMCLVSAASYFLARMKTHWQELVLSRHVHEHRPSVMPRHI